MLHEMCNIILLDLRVCISLYTILKEQTPMEQVQNKIIILYLLSIDLAREI
jgi:hypothetical protein